MKIYVSIDEWYPIHTLSTEGWGCEKFIELTEDEYAECKKSEDAFTAWQDKLSALYDKAKLRPSSEVYGRENGSGTSS